MRVTRFKNGNFNLKLDDDFIKNESILVNVIYALYDHDCELFGDEYCISNYSMAVDMYNHYNDTIITIPYYLLEKLERGEIIKLYAHKPDEYERELYNEMMEA